jgi:hypothetical protein
MYIHAITRATSPQLPVDCFNRRPGTQPSQAGDRGRGTPRGPSGAAEGDSFRGPSKPCWISRKRTADVNDSIQHDSALVVPTRCARVRRNARRVGWWLSRGLSQAPRAQQPRCDRNHEPLAARRVYECAKSHNARPRSTSERHSAGIAMSGREVDRRVAVIDRCRAMALAARLAITTAVSTSRAVADCGPGACPECSRVHGPQAGCATLVVVDAFRAKCKSRGMRRHRRRVTPGRT